MTLEQFMSLAERLGVPLAILLLGGFVVWQWGNALGTWAGPLVARLIEASEATSRTVLINRQAVASLQVDFDNATAAATQQHHHIAELVLGAREAANEAHKAADAAHEAAEKAKSAAELSRAASERAEQAVTILRHELNPGKA